MAALGLLMMLLGALAILAAVFLSDGTAQIMGLDLPALQIFLIGVVAGALILWGFGILKFGTKRGLANRKERKRLAELNEKLDRVEAEQQRRNSDHA